MIACMAITSTVALNNEPVLMCANRYGDLLLFFTSSMFGTISMYMLARLIDYNKALQYVGRNTIPILLIHFFVLMLTHVLLHKIMPEIDNYRFPIYILHFAIAISACCGFSWIVNSYCPWMLKLRFNKYDKK